jgi:hypothetical protein
MKGQRKIIFIFAAMPIACALREEFYARCGTQNRLLL